MKHKKTYKKKILATTAAIATVINPVSFNCETHLRVFANSSKIEQLENSVTKIMKQLHDTQAVKSNKHINDLVGFFLQLSFENKKKILKSFARELRYCVEMLITNKENPKIIKQLRKQLQIPGKFKSALSVDEKCFSSFLKENLSIEKSCEDCFFVEVKYYSATDEDKQKFLDVFNLLLTWVLVNKTKHHIENLQPYFQQNKVFENQLSDTSSAKLPQTTACLELSSQFQDFKDEIEITQIDNDSCEIKIKKDCLDPSVVKKIFNSNGEVKGKNGKNYKVKKIGYLGVKNLEETYIKYSNLKILPPNSGLVVELPDSIESISLHYFYHLCSGEFPKKITFTISASLEEKIKNNLKNENQENKFLGLFFQNSHVNYYEDVLKERKKTPEQNMCGVEGLVARNGIFSERCTDRFLRKLNNKYGAKTTKKIYSNHKSSSDFFKEQGKSVNELVEKISQTQNYEYDDTENEFLFKLIMNHLSEVFENFLEYSDENIKEILLGKSQSFPIFLKNNKRLCPFLKRYGNQKFYGEVTSRITSVVSYVLKQYHSKCEKKNSITEGSLIDFLFRLNSFLSKLRYDVAYLTNTSDGNCFGSNINTPVTKQTYILDSIVFSKNSEGWNYIKKRIDLGYFAEQRFYMQCPFGISLNGRRCPLIIELFENELSYLKFNPETKKYKAKVDNQTKEIELDELSDIYLTTFHVKQNSAIYAELEFFDVFLLASELKNNTDPKKSNELKEDFKRKLLAFAWKSTQASTWERGQATLLVETVRALAIFAGYNLQMTDEWDESQADYAKVTISMDVAALLTPLKQRFIDDNLKNISLEKF